MSGRVCCAQVPHLPPSPSKALLSGGGTGGGRPALQRSSAPGPMAGPFHQAQRAQQARLQHIAEQRQAALLRKAQEQVRAAG